MWRVISILLACLLLAQPVALAAEPANRAQTSSPFPSARIASGSGVIAPAIAREVARLAATTNTRERPPVEQGPARERGWIGRHPTLFGALVGAGVGTVAAATMDNELFCGGGDEDCIFNAAEMGGGRVLIGTGIGAKIGALAGFVVSLVQK